MNNHILVILFSAPLIGSCQEKVIDDLDTLPSSQTDEISDHLILGLRSSVGGSFTLSPKGSALSILYDNAALRWNEEEESSVPTDQPKQYSSGFTITSRISPLTGTVHIKGSAFGTSAPKPRFRLTVGDRQFDLSGQVGQEDFQVCRIVEIPSQITPVRWQMELPRIDGEDIAIQVESIDLAISDNADCASE